MVSSRKDLAIDTDFEVRCVCIGSKVLKVFGIDQ